MNYKVFSTFSFDNYPNYRLDEKEIDGIKYIDLLEGENKILSITQPKNGYAILDYNGMKHSYPSVEEALSYFDYKMRINNHEKLLQIQLVNSGDFHQKFYFYVFKDLLIEILQNSPKVFSAFPDLSGATYSVFGILSIDAQVKKEFSLVKDIPLRHSFTTVALTTVNTEEIFFYLNYFSYFSERINVNEVAKL